MIESHAHDPDVIFVGERSRLFEQVVPLGRIQPGLQIRLGVEFQDFLNVKDQLAKIQCVGSVQLWGSGDYAMRIWLNPQKITGRGLTPQDVIAAVRSQNLQVSAGAIGGPPYGTGVELRHERR